MGTQTFINYWIGQEPTPPSPTLDTMPAAVAVAPLAFVTIDDGYHLGFDFLLQGRPQSEVMSWIKTVQGNGTKVQLSIISDKLGSLPDVGAFTTEVADAVSTWGVDGIDLDFEPPYQSDTLLQLASALRATLGDDALLTAPIYGAWSGMPDFLKSFANELNFVTTMDYTPYPGLDGTKDAVNSYVGAIGDPGKVAIGVSCMGPVGSGNITPLEDVIALCQWEPDAGAKKGVMLYTFSYDLDTRKAGGTGEPDGAYTAAIEGNLP